MIINVFNVVELPMVQFCGFIVFIPCLETERRPWVVVLDGTRLPYDLQWNKTNLYLSFIILSNFLKNICLLMRNLCLSELSAATA